MIKYFRLFSLLSLNYFLKHKFKIFFAIIGMATGIAIYVTTNIYSDTIYNDVRQKEKLLQQSEKWTIKSTNGRIAEDKINSIIDLNLFYKIYPKSERFEYIKDNKNETTLVKILGIDLLRYANSKYEYETSNNSPPFLASNYFSKGQTLNFKNYKETVDIQNIIPESSNTSPLLITDIGRYQNMFTDQGWIDELEVILIENKSKKQIDKELKTVDPNFTIIQHKGNVQNKQSLSDAFLVNLRFFSLIALIISIFLIYQFYRFILIERENEFSKLRAVGMSNNDLFKLLFFELTIIGIISALLGLVGGAVVSIISLDFILKTVNTFYYNVDAKTIYLSLKLILICLLVSLTGCYLAGLHPVLRFIKKTDPNQSANSTYDQKRPLYIRAFFILGIILLSGLIILLLKENNLKPGSLSAISLLLFTTGSLFILPFTISKLSSLIKHYFVNLDFRLKTAFSYINQTLVRQCFYVLSLGILIGFVISLIIFISSFRQTINNWIVQVTPADVYLQSEFNTLQQPFPISNELFEFVSNHPDITKYDFISRYLYSYKNVPIQIRATNLDILKQTQRLKFKSLSKPISEINENWVFISEPFQKKYKKNVGDSLEIVGSKNTKNLKIMGVFYDYVSEKGAILIDHKLGKQLFIQNDIHGMTIYNLDETKQLQLENELSIKFPEESLEIESKKALREGTLNTFDKTFNIVWFLAILASVISIVTIINSSSMVFLERLYEFTQLRAIGASSEQIFSFLSNQMFLLTILSLIVAYYCSSIFIFIIDKINWAFFGWSIDIIFDWKPYLISMVLLFALTYITIKIPFNKSIENMKFYSLRND